MVRFNEKYPSIDSYEKDDYYLSHDAEMHLLATKGFLKMSDVKKLSMKDLYKKLEEGRIDDLEVMRKKIIVDREKGKNVSSHRTGLDMTITVHKSVSLLLVDEESRKAVLRAFREALTSVFEYCADLAYKRAPGGRFLVKTGEMIAHQFLHFVNRDQEPHLHAHVVIHNVTIDEDGRLRAIDYSEFFKNKDNINFVFQRALARELQKAGYKNLFFDDCYNVRLDIPQKFLDVFSERKKEVGSKLTEIIEDLQSGRVGQKIQNASFSRLSELAVLMTRKPKREVERETLFRSWTERLEEKDLSVEELIKEAKKEKDLLLKEATAEDVVIVERFLKNDGKLFFSKKDVERILFSSGRILTDEFWNVFSDLIETHIMTSEDKEVFYLKSQAEGFVRVFDLLNEMKRTKVVGGVSYDQRVFDGLSEEQKDAFKYITKNYLTLIQGYAGVGKSAIIKCFNREDVVSISLSALAANNINASHAFTIHSFLGLNVEQEKTHASKRSIVRDKIVVIDEAGMIDKDLFEKLLVELKDAGAKRIVIMGDVNQMMPPQGHPIWPHLLKRFKVKRIETIQRQKDPEVLTLCKLLASEAGKERREPFISNLLKKKAIFFTDDLETNHKLVYNIIDQLVERRFDVLLVNDNNIVDLFNRQCFERACELRKQGRKIDVPVIINKNNYRIGVFNGQKGLLKDDGFIHLENGKKVSIDEVSYQYGFAITVAKAQGQTYNNVFYYPTYADDSNTIYTAITRTRGGLQILFDGARSFDHVCFEIYKTKNDYNEDIIKNHESKIRFNRLVDKEVQKVNRISKLIVSVCKSDGLKSIIKRIQEKESEKNLCKKLNFSYNIKR